MTPTVDQYVAAYLTAMRAPLKQRTQFGPAGRAVIHSDGEKVIYGPDGTPIRIIEDTLHGTHVEHGDHLHAVVRPGVMRVRTTTTMEH